MHLIWKRMEVGERGELTRLYNRRNTREKMEIIGGRREQIKKTVSLFLAS